MDALQAALGGCVAVGMLSAIAFACYAINARWLRTPSVSLRFACLGLSLLVVESALFHVLIALHLFRPAPALVALVACGAALARGLRYGLPAFLADLRADVRRARMLLRTLLRGRLGAVHLAVGVLPLVLWSRVAVAPPLDWDALTTHAVKAGFFVQRGAPLVFDAPGGFGLTRYYPAGAEIFWAWAMLPFHGDLVARWVDLWQWTLLGVVLYALAAELGVRAQYRPAGVLYVLALPATWVLVGDGGQELAGNCALLGGVTAGLAFMRRRQACFLGFGVLLLALCCGIKLALLPAAALCGLVLLCDAVSRRRDRARALLAFSTGAVLGLLLLAPFAIENWRNTGYPLGYVPAKLFGLRLGVANSAMLWYQDHPELRQFSFAREWFTLAELFAPFTEPGLHISRASLVPLSLATVLFAFGVALRPRSTLLLAAVAAGALAFYYQESFKVVRLLWDSTGRFLLHLVAVCTLGSLAWCRRSSWAAWLYRAFLCGCAAVHVAVNFDYGFARLEWLTLGAVLASVLAAVVARPLLRRAVRWRAAPVYGLCAVAMLCGGLDAVRSRTRVRSIAAVRKESHVPRYWQRAAARMDDPAEPRVIAVTAGPFQSADNWFLYPFLGRKLQNRLTYVPMTASGRIRDFSLHDDLSAGADLERWYARLGGEGAAFVVSFVPPSVELRFMRRRTDLFEQLEGGDRWGLFRLRSPTGAPAREATPVGRP